MTREEGIKLQLAERFPALADKVVVKRDRRIFAEIPQKDFPEALQFMVKELQFTILCTITAADETEHYSMIYHFARPDGMMLNVRVPVPKDNPVHQSIIGIFPNAEIYEREAIDLVGIKVQGLPEGNRYPLPDDWPAESHPLRKDWKKPE